MAVTGSSCSVFLLVLVVALYHHAGVNARRHDGGGTHNKHTRRELGSGPRGTNLARITPEEQNNTEVVTQVGGTATIKCYTHFLGDEMVTWLKRDEEHLLTAGVQVYSSETRYSIVHARHQKLWELTIMNVRLTDAGTYECQLTTHPPMALFFNLKVLEPRAVIQEAPELHLQTGANLRLHCMVEDATEPPVYFFWFHNGSMINYAPRRPLEVTKHPFKSVLSIANVTWDDAGFYRCEPQKASPANLTIHVLAGEKHAALHNGQSDESPEPTVTASGSSTLLAILPLMASSSFLLIMLANFHLFESSTSSLYLLLER